MDLSVSNHRLVAASGELRFVESPNIGGALAPTLLLLHYTASGPRSDAAAYFASPAAKVSAHVVIGRDGAISQCVPFNRVAWHAGSSRWSGRDGTLYIGLNAYAIGIEFENWGALTKSGRGWLSWSGSPVEAGTVVLARHSFGVPEGGWEAFTEPQVEAGIAVARALCACYGICEILGHDDVAPGRKSDPGPAFNMAAFRARVLGRSAAGDAAMIVRSPTGLNIRSGPGLAHPPVRATPLPNGSAVLVHQAEQRWRLVSAIDADGKPAVSGWVHGDFLVAP